MLKLIRIFQVLAFYSLPFLANTKSAYHGFRLRKKAVVHFDRGSIGETCTNGYRPSENFTMLYNQECVTCGQTCCPLRQMQRRDNEQIDKRIREGIDATKNEFPWSVAIFEIQRHGYKFICGGALLSKTVIATAAHCVKNRNLRMIRVTIGEIDILVDGDGFRHDKIGALKGIQNFADIPHGNHEPHEKDTETESNIRRKDLAILRLVKPTKKNRLCLRRKAERQVDPVCFGIGHGMSVKGGVISRISSKLQKATVVLDFDNNCLRGRLHNSGNMLCASNAHNRTVSCSLDSGSPVFCRLSKTDECSSYYLAGIFSFKHDTNEGRCEGRFTVLADMVSTSQNAISHFAATAASHDDLQETYMLAEGQAPCSSMIEPWY